MIPPARHLQGPVLRALRTLGNTGSIAAIEDAVRRQLAISEEEARARHRPDRLRSELAYRLAWARTRLKRDGLIERVGASAWRLTATGAQAVPPEAGANATSPRLPQPAVS